MRYKAHMISSLCAAIGGIIMTCQNTASMCNAGEGSDMDCIAAVTLGGLALAGGKGKMVGTLIGITILSVLFNGMTMLNVLAEGHARRHPAAGGLCGLGQKRRSEERLILRVIWRRMVRSKGHAPRFLHKMEKMVVK